MVEQDKNFRYIIRIANTDLDGNKAIKRALRKIKGVNFMLSNAVCAAVGINKEKKAGYLTDLEAQKINETIADPKSMDIPIWMLNRRKDLETGEDIHLVTTDLKFTNENDVKLLRKIKSYKGVRHASGLPCRGQRTKSNFRRSKCKGKGGLGVQRKKK